MCPKVKETSLLTSIERCLRNSLQNVTSYTRKIFNAHVPKESDVSSKLFVYYCQAADLEAYAANPRPTKEGQGLEENRYRPLARRKATSLRVPTCGKARGSCDPSFQHE